MDFASGRVHGRSEVNTTSGSGVFSFTRSILHTIRRNLTTIPPEDTTQPDVEAHSGDFEGHLGTIHTGVAE